MSTWTWVLTGLCAAGALLPLVPALAVLRLALRLRSRMEEMQRSRLVTSLESLQLQRARLERVAAKAAPLAQRARTAAQTLRASVNNSGYAQMRDALQSAGAEISALFAALR